MAPQSSNPHGITPAKPMDEPGLVALAARLAAARGLDQSSPAWLDFRQAVLGAQVAVLEGLCSTLPALSTPPALGGPLLALDAFDLPAQPMGELWLAMVAATRALGQPSDALDALEAAAVDEPLFLAQLARAAIQADPQDLEAIAARFGAPIQAVSFLGRTLAAPFLALATRLVSADHIAAAGRPTGACPYCGSPAGLATLSRQGEGKRHLHCGLCGSSWQYPRIGCPRCGSDDQQQLAFLRLDDQDSAWIETCDACQGAIKTVDERRLAPGAAVVPVAEDILSLHLDLLAGQHGYGTGPGYTATG